MISDRLFHVRNEWRYTACFLFFLFGSVIRLATIEKGWDLVPIFLSNAANAHSSNTLALLPNNHRNPGCDKAALEQFVTDTKESKRSEILRAIHDVSWQGYRYFVGLECWLQNGDSCDTTVLFALIGTNFKGKPL
ncbi:hypothetical protein BDV41DRAFT_414415 [Aspergillus transmontanensis]|uniref:Uncharacterized protein n=1 Tax=Aspergillus transmontanensis TaxID=1034304 RepID=A0A5N6WCI7_9EURO|nr:hypothetical protein BDV41DRAFT_414415 [Aspergillus transmontanensis]